MEQFFFAITTSLSTSHQESISLSQVRTPNDNIDIVSQSFTNFYFSLLQPSRIKTVNILVNDEIQPGKKKRIVIVLLCTRFLLLHRTEANGNGARSSTFLRNLTYFLLLCCVHLNS